MDTYRIVLFWGVLFCTSYLLTCVVRLYALKVNRLDLPNERSSHVVPTPRGGGIAFVATFLLGLCLTAWWYQIYSGLILALAVIAIGLGGVGFLDDRFQLSAGIRIVVQTISACIALYCIHFFQISGVIFGGLGVLYLVGLINIFNFLDGIDGYAVMESCFVAIVMTLWCGLTLPGVLLGCFTASVLGFGVWNFPRAKIFMGDAGSGFLGGALGLFAIYGSFLSQQFFWVSTLLMSIFIVDAGLTLMIRFFRKEKIWKAHRQHAYQHLAIYLKSHPKVTLGAACINVCWILPWALFVERYPAWSILGLFATYLPLLVMAWYWRAGRV